MRHLAEGPQGDVAAVAILAAYGTLLLSTLWDRPYLAALLLVPSPVILGFRLGDPRRAAAMGFAGAILGPLTEMACVEGGAGPTPPLEASLTSHHGTFRPGPAFLWPSGFWQEPF